MKLTAEHLTKIFIHKTAVNDFSYTFTNGIYGLLGPNGSGKSTLMRMLCDILKPNQGHIYLDGTLIQTMNEDYRDILGYLPQDFGYYPQFNAYDFLMYFATLKGFSKKEAKDRVEMVLEMVNLTSEKKHKIKTFSGGMKQRLGIAQALLNDPKILIVDEPTAGLDPKERANFKSILARCANDKIVILSTHIVSDIETLAQHILIMKDGKLHQHGTREELLLPLHDQVYTFICEEQEVEKISKEMIVTAMMPVQNKMQIRAIISKPAREDMRREEPSLEDLYLSIFKDAI